MPDPQTSYDGSMPDPQTIIMVLKQEQALRTRHCQVLEAQGRALMLCDRMRFAALETDHAALLVHLQMQDAARRSALADDAGEPVTVADVLAQMDESHRAHRTLTALRHALGALAERSRTLMQRNEMLIRSELSYLAFSLDLFVEAGRASGQSYGSGMLTGGRLGLDQRA